MMIAYVTSRWGEPTQTFVRREAAAARRAGHEVVAFSIKRPGPDTHGVAVVHLTGRTLIRHLARALGSSPGAQFRGLAHAVYTGSARNALPTTAAWCIGTAWSSAAPEVEWIHAHFAWVSATAADAFATARHKRFSIFAHAHDIYEHRLVDGYTRSKLRRAAVVLVESEGIRAHVQRTFGREAFVQRVGVPEGLLVDGVTPRTGRLVLSIGSLVPKKGHDDLLRGVAGIEGTSVRILGEGPARSDLETLIHDLSLSGRVTLDGWADGDTVVAALDAATVLCLPSKETPSGDRDGVPNVLIEAMARGVPVVSTRLSGIPDLLGDDRGILVDPGDVRGLERALRHVLEHPDDAARRAERALEHVRRFYLAEQNWDELEARITAAAAPA